MSVRIGEERNASTQQFVSPRDLLRNEVRTALAEKGTVRLSKAPEIPAGAAKVVVDSDWTKGRTATRVGEAVYIHSYSLKSPGAEMTTDSWHKLASVPPALDASLTRTEVQHAVENLKPPPTGFNPAWSSRAPDRKDVLARIPLAGSRTPFTVSALILKGNRMVFEQVLTGGKRPAQPGDERYSRPTSLPAKLAPAGFDWAQFGDFTRGRH